MKTPVPEFASRNTIYKNYEIWGIYHDDVKQKIVLLGK